MGDKTGDLFLISQCLFLVSLQYFALHMEKEIVICLHGWDKPRH
jgi:hypothetical protein